MEKRKMSNLGISTSLLGFGCMRFPLLENGKIDETKAEEMIDLAIGSGVNYIDTAFPYHNGDSEPFVGKVLNKYDRSSYYLATKLPCWDVKSVDDAKRIFENQLKRLDKDYVDFYLLHALNKERWNEMLNLGVVAFCEQLKEEGKIKYLGFSFHDDYEAFEEILTYRQWDFCQIQYNYMDTDVQAGDKGYELTEKLNIPLIIMEPIKGGLLAALPDDIEERLSNLKAGVSTASWALRWVGTHQNVKVILSGMSTPEQVKDNLVTFDSFKALTDSEMSEIADIANTLKSRVRNGCTGCSYCMPCPMGVDIPKSFKIWNNYSIYQAKDIAANHWKRDISESQKPINCVECGKCEKSCPQKISIRKDLKELQLEMDTLCSE